MIWLAMAACTVLLYSNAFECVVQAKYTEKKVELAFYDYSQSWL